jgi:acyl-CoA carboxylase subunit beta
VSVAVEALRREKVPFLSVLVDPTYGGVSASYAMQADVRLAVAEARIGFAGPAVILNTMCEMDQARYDKACPPQFQSAEYVLEHGQIDLVVDPAEAGLEQQPAIDQAVARLLSVLYPQGVKGAGGDKAGDKAKAGPLAVPAVEAAGLDTAFDYTKSRKMDRLQCQDIMEGVFEDFTELKGDGRVASDACIRGGLARFGPQQVVVIGCAKGHTPQAMQASNYGMPAPAGYRTALRLFALAERFGLPIVTLVDTCGAWPSFEAESDGQSEAIATNLTAMASLKVPVVTLIVGEGGSGGALGIAMGNKIAMLSGAYYGVISPEGAASILGRYADDAHKAKQFPQDCQELAKAQQIYANQLQALGVVDTILYEKEGETFEQCPHLQASIRAFIAQSLNDLAALSPDELVAQRFTKFRGMGAWVDRSWRVDLAFFCVGTGRHRVDHCNKQHVWRFSLTILPPPGIRLQASTRCWTSPRSARCWRRRRPRRRRARSPARRRPSRPRRAACWSTWRRR